MAVKTVAMSSNATMALHPFFSKASVDCRSTLVEPSAINTDHEPGRAGAVATEQPHEAPPVVEKSGQPKSRNGDTSTWKHQTSIDKSIRQEDVSHDEPSHELDDHDHIAEPNSIRRKRRRTSETTSVDVGAGDAHSVQSQGSLEGGKGLAQQEPFTDDSIKPRTPPKRMLKLSASGKLASPMAKAVQKDDEATKDQPKRRGRPRKNKETTIAKQLVVCVRYSVKQSTESELSFGTRVDRILAGQLRVDTLLVQSSPKKKRTPKKSAKATHPFFTDKPKSVKLPKIESPRRTAAITPGKLRVQAQHERGAGNDDSVPTYESALLKDRLMIKHPGAKEPLWPAKGMSHVRGDMASIAPAPMLQRRKQKHRRPTVYNSLLSQYAQRLVPESDPPLRADGFSEPRKDLRVPEKLLLTGVDIAKLALREIRAPLAQGSIDELAPSAQVIHPALENLYQSIPPYLSAFDNLRGEQYGWAQKHAPERAECVLQSPKEMQVLKSWLQSLTVNTVGVRQETIDEVVKPRKKRKIRHSEMDDFIADENDDVHSMCTISDGENNSSQSMVQSQVNGRASNTVLISGPHGCGKTAAVYAVAKELQYRVFEISSSERRAGKDVLDKIGNVTENHIVKRHSHDESDVSGAEDKERIDKAFKQDLESGKQGKLAAFFSTSSKSAKSKPAAVVKAKIIENVKTAIKKASKEQQQSLILLEEVDILFASDKEFWNTVIRLITTSKRPFILTCNDEDLVPIQALTVHAVLRLLPIDNDTAIDYLLLVAAREGHLLQRQAVAHLWQSSGHDLRRCLTSLDFWCRMGVGSVRDGLDWMYQRWPVGSDLDAKGRPLRVVSKGTYQIGMGEHLVPKSDPSVDNAHSLKDMDTSLQALSNMDILSRPHELDPTLPPLPPKRRMHYIEGLALLDAPKRVDYTHLRADIENAMEQLIRHCYPQPYAQETSLPGLTRKSFAVFDSLAFTPSAVTGLEASVFDGPLNAVVLDVAPYVRQVVMYEQLLHEQRQAIFGPSKRARTTRAARSALEGGQRQLTRREQWWEGTGDLRAVLSTAGGDWHLPDAYQSPPSSSESLVEEMTGIM